VKKLIKVLAAVVVLVFVVILALPLFINVDKFRPQIISAIEQNMNADAELGKLSLNIWGGFNIGIEKLAIREKGVASPPVFAMKDVKLSLAFLPLLTGKVSATLHADGPEINVIKGKDGKMNVMRLMKPSTAQAEAQKPEAKKGGAGAPPVTADISVEIKDGRINYSDEITGTKTGLSGLALGLYHIGLNQPIQVRFQSAMDVKGIKDLTLKGKADLNGTVAAYMKADGLDKFVADLKADASDLTLKYGALFDKESGVALRLETKLEATPSDLNLEWLHAVLKDLAVDADGTVKNFDAPVLNMHVRSSKFVLEDWKRVIGMLKDFDPHGNVDFDVKVTGPTSNINIDGVLEAHNVGAKLEALTQPISDLNAKLKFTQNSAELSQFGFKIGQSDMNARGMVKNFNKPNVVIAVSSKLFDMDSMLPKKAPEQEAAEEKAEAEAAKGKKQLTDAEIEQMAKGPLNTIRKNPMLRALVLNAKANFDKLVVHKATITNVSADVSFIDLVLALKSLKANAFNGAVNANMSVDLKPNDIVYKAGGDVNGIDINAAIASQMETLKDTVKGKTFAKFEVGGAGVTKTKAKATLAGHGNFRLEGGSWSALSVLQQIGEKLKSIPQAKDKLGGVQVSGRIRKATSDFTIGGGRFNILNLVADLEEANTGLTGQGYVDFDKNLSLAGKILTPASDPKMPSSLKAADGRAALPYEIGCLATSPCFKAEKTIGPIAQAYGKEELKKAASQGLQKLKENVKDERIQKVLEKVDANTVNDALKKIGF